MALTAVFFFHGGQKAFGWFGGDGWQATMEAWAGAEGLHLPYLLVAALIVVELAVSVALFLGFLTRLAGLLVVVLMGCALFFIYGGTTFQAVEFPLMVMAAGLALTASGGGYLSLDRAISSSLLPYVG